MFGKCNLHVKSGDLAKCRFCRAWAQTLMQLPGILPLVEPVPIPLPTHGLGHPKKKLLASTDMRLARRSPQWAQLSRGKGHRPLSL